MLGTLNRQVTVTVLSRSAFVVLAVFVAASSAIGFQLTIQCPDTRSQLVLTERDTAQSPAPCSSEWFSSDGKVVIPQQIAKLRARHSAHPRNQAIARQLCVALLQLAEDMLSDACNDPTMVAEASLSISREAMAVDPTSAAAIQTVRSRERLVADLQAMDNELRAPDGGFGDGRETIATPIPRAPIDDDKPIPPE